MSTISRQSYTPKRKPAYEARKNAESLAPAVFDASHDLWNAKITVGAKGTPAYGRVCGQNDAFGFYVDTSRSPLPPRLVVAPLKQTADDGAMPNWQLARSRPMSAADIGALTTVLAESAKPFAHDFRTMCRQFELALKTGDLPGGRACLAALADLDEAYSRSLDVFTTINDPKVWEQQKLPEPVSFVVAPTAVATGARAAMAITTPLGFTMFTERQ